jgi:hypothetical protein
LLAFRRLVRALKRQRDATDGRLTRHKSRSDSHLHQFEIGLRFGDPELLNQDMPDDFQQASDSSSMRLRDFHFDYKSELPFVVMRGEAERLFHRRKRLMRLPTPAGDCWMTFEYSD